MVRVHYRPLKILFLVYKVLIILVKVSNTYKGDLMDFRDEVYALSKRAQELYEQLNTEEATKTALILPFIKTLGYDIFDPLEVVPEFTSDVGTKKGEKVDYAILKNGKPIILFECKSCKTDLDITHASQLFRYFSVTESRFGVLTNGIIYQFFSDLEQPNRMDDKPFLEINLFELRDDLIEELKKFRKESFDLEKILDIAGDLKYTREVRKLLTEQFNNPSKDFVQFFASKVYSGRLTKSVKEKFTQVVKQAFSQYINDRIEARLKSALERESEKEELEEKQLVEAQPEVQTDEGIVTTQEELQGYYIVKAILSEIIKPQRVVLKDWKSYCNVLLDGKNRKVICRFRFGQSKKYFCLLNEKKEEVKFPIESVEEIFKFAQQLKEIVKHYDSIPN